MQTQLPKNTLHSSLYLRGHRSSLNSPLIFSVSEGFFLAIEKCSYCAKILLALTKAKTELFVSQIMEETGFTRRTTVRHLKKLIEFGIVKEQCYGRIHAFCVGQEKSHLRCQRIWITDELYCILEKEAKQRNLTNGEYVASLVELSRLVSSGRESSCKNRKS